MQSMNSPSRPSQCLLCLGFGRIAEAFLRLTRSDPENPFASVLGTTRDPIKAEAMRAAGVEPVHLEAAIDPGTLQRITHILVSIPPDDAGDVALRLLGADLRQQAPALQWVGYLSTTGVYGDLGGRWAAEWTPVNPQSIEAKRRALAEQQWLEFGRSGGPAVQIFRLPGLYGPGRSAFDRLRDGSARRIVKPGQIFSRAHEADVASALVASMRQPNPGRVYNICDDDPAPPQDVITFAAQLLGVTPPAEIPIAEARLSPQAMRFYAESKRVTNARAKAELGWRPAYPSYEAGLRAILAAEQ